MTHLHRLIAAFFMLVLAGTASLAAPAVSLTPKIGPPTTAVTVSGTDFGANAAIDVYFDTAHLCITFASGAGAASCMITVPKETQPQTHWLTMLQRNTGNGAQKPFTVRTDMAQFHGRDARHNGNNPFENTLNVNNVGDLDTLWSKPIGRTGGSAVVAGGKIYVGSLAGKLNAFNSATGAAVAGFPVDVGAEIIYATPAVGAGRVFIGSDNGKLHAFDALTGATVAGFPKVLGGSIYSSPALALGNVYVGCNDGFLYAFNATTGVPVAGFPLNLTGLLYGSPTVIGKKVYIGSSSGQLYSFDALTGAAISGFPVVSGNAIYGTVAGSGLTGFFGSADAKLYGFRLADGAIPAGFPVPTSGSISSSPAVAGGKVFAGSDGAGEISAWFTAGGLAWSQILGGSADGSPMVANGVVYTGTQHRLFALSAATGAILWSADATQEGFTSPLVADGILYYPARDGNLYAFSVNGRAPASRLAGGALGVRPALSALKPDYSLKAQRKPED